MRFNRTRWLETQAREKSEMGVAALDASLRRRKPENPLKEFIRSDLNIDECTHIVPYIEYDTNHIEFEGDDGKLEWRPDLRLCVRRSSDERNSSIHSYLVEVKTGEYAEFRNTQKEAMLEVAERHEADAIAIFVRLKKMPDNWGIRIRKMGKYI
jgi:hypothetical protein